MSATTTTEPTRLKPALQDNGARPVPPMAYTPEEALKKGIIETEVAPATARWMTWVFVACIFTLPLLQAACEILRGEMPQALELFTRNPTKANLHAYEDELARSSVVKQFVQPNLQAQLTGWGRFGNHKVVLGRDGWLFYQPGIDYLMGTPILSELRIGTRAKKVVDEHSIQAHPDPRPAILEFDRYCKAQGIHLVLVPIPDKAAIEALHLSGRFAAGARLKNPDYDRLVGELKAAGVDVFDPTPAPESAGVGWFLKQDTHWTPQWMEHAAGQLAAHLRNAVKLAPAPAEPAYKTQPQQVNRVGDLVDMLQLPQAQRIFPPQTVTIQTVLHAQTGQPHKSNQQAEVLILGDSFCNIFSAQAMGWGESAGFVEHLSFQLGLPLDRITQNDAGAHATRVTLGRELARNPLRLAGKKAIVWEFAAREFTHGEWRPVALNAGPATQPAEASMPEMTFHAAAAGSELLVAGTVAQVSKVPVPGTVPYKDHIMVLHLTNLQRPDGSASAAQAVVYAWSMRDNKLTRTAKVKAGDRIRLKLKAWSGFAEKLGSINRSELDDLDLQLETPCWGEEAE